MGGKKLSQPRLSTRFSVLTKINWKATYFRYVLLKCKVLLASFKPHNNREVFIIIPTSK